MVLGIVVDDAIVIADNYVELLDHKVPGIEAAWRSATEVIVPVFTATVTIIASFLPLLILTGTAGRVHRGPPDHRGDRIGGLLHRGDPAHAADLPVVDFEGVARSRRGNRGPEEKEEPAGPDPGDLLPGRSTPSWPGRYWRCRSGSSRSPPESGCSPWSRNSSSLRRSATSSSIDVWMPQGTRIEATDAVMGRIERKLAGSKGVAHYVSVRRPERAAVLLQREPPAARPGLRPVHREHRLGPGLPSGWSPNCGRASRRSRPKRS